MYVMSLRTKARNSSSMDLSSRTICAAAATSIRANASSALRRISAAISPETLISVVLTERAAAILGNAAHALRNLPGLVARAFEIGNAPGGGHQEPQVASCRLSTNNDVAHFFVDFNFHRIEPVLALDDLLNRCQIEGGQCLHPTCNLYL